MKALVGPYEMSAYFIVHLMPDPLRGYGCQKDKCTELVNHVCVELDDRNSFSTKCVDMQDGEITWSDGSYRASSVLFNARCRVAHSVSSSSKCRRFSISVLVSMWELPLTNMWNSIQEDGLDRSA